MAEVEGNKAKATEEEKEEEEEDSTPGYFFKEDKSLWVKFHVPMMHTLGKIRFNPVVTLVSISLIWIFVIICCKVKDLPFADYRTWSVDKFTWLYVGSLDAWAVFAIMLYFSKYADTKIGKKDDVPEYSDATWFMMLFACGIGTGLFFFGVAEPVFHYTGANRYSADPTMPDNTLAQVAINLTLYHWGVHGWIAYSLVGLLLGLLYYREGLPMTMKSCFYPLIGDRIFGWMGDLIDVISIVTTLFGVCTSLGLGTRQLNTGLNIINPDIPGDDVTVQVLIIWGITIIATISTVTGVGKGIRRLSEICFGVGMFLMLVVLFMEDTFFVLNLYVQSLGYYLQNIVQLGFHSDSWEKLGPSAGFKERGRWTPDTAAEGLSKTRGHADGPDDWMDSWTMFYWGWWISWCPFVGMFIAKISKGRTLKQFINGTLTAPVLYSFMWMTIFGGAGISQERNSAALGLCCGKAGTDNWFLNADSLNRSISGHLEETIKLGSYLSVCKGACGDCAKSVLASKAGNTYEAFLEEYVRLGRDFGSVSADRSHARLSCHATEQMWFDVMRSYGDIGEFLAGFSLIGIVLYFVTSADSGSLVIDCLAANGASDPPKIQRVFWSFNVGATATALLVAGGKSGLTALQTAGLLAGLPQTFLTSLICVSIWKTVKVAAGELDPDGPKFSIGLFDCFAAQPYSDISLGTNIKLLFGFLKNVIMAPLTLAEVNKRLNGGSKVFTFFSFATFGLFLAFHLMQCLFDGCWAIAWFFYLCFTTVMTCVRMEVRSNLGIGGNVVEDFFACLFLYPNSALQMDLTTEIRLQEQRRKEQDGLFEVKT